MGNDEQRDEVEREAVFDKVRKNRFKKLLVHRGRLLTQAVLLVVIAVCIAGIALYYHNRSAQEALNESLRLEAQAKAEEAAKEAERLAAEAAARAAEDEAEAAAAAEAALHAYVCPLDFDSLHATNDDIYAWIRVEGTSVDYPVLQSGEDDPEDFYLGHNLDRSAGHPGCIYSQKFNAQDFSDPVTILYGHNMRNGSMFATLHRYEDGGFFDEHPYVYVYTPEQELVYAVYAAYYYSDKLIPYYFNYFESANDYELYLSEMSLYGDAAGGHLRSGVSPSDNSHTITLSTCNADGSARYLIQCVLIDYLGDGALGDGDLAECDDALLDGWRDLEPEWEE